ncbi:MAG: hypothetical protein AAFN77_01855 [Planctomycetota bacterium]
MVTFLGRCGSALLLAVFLISGLCAQDIEAPSNDAVFVKVTRDRELVGSPIELSQIKVTTGFGDVTIPMTKVDGIKFHANNDDSAVIAFKNGDLITGKIDLQKVSIKTEWGKAHINVSQIETLTSTKAARFFPDGNKGWRFTSGSTDR